MAALMGALGRVRASDLKIRGSRIKSFPAPVITSGLASKPAGWDIFSDKAAWLL